MSQNLKRRGTQVVDVALSKYEIDALLRSVKASGHVGGSLRLAVISLERAQAEARRQTEERHVPRS